MPTLLATLAEKDGLLEEWADDTADFAGNFTSHRPIKGSGQSCDATDAWGCNVCGKGWPCLTKRTLAALDQGGTANG